MRIFQKVESGAARLADPENHSTASARSSHFSSRQNLIYPLDKALLYALHCSLLQIEILVAVISFSSTLE